MYAANVYIYGQFFIQVVKNYLLVACVYDGVYHLLFYCNIGNNCHVVSLQ